LRALFAQRPYVWLLTGRTTARLAIQIQSVALGWQVYAVARQHGSVNQAAFAVGMLGLAQFLPMAAFSLLAGDAADRYDRRTILSVSLVVQLCTAAAFAVMAWSGFDRLWSIYALGAVFGAARAFYMPASTALAPMLVSRALLPRSIVINSLGTQLGMIVGPALGGFMIAASPALAFAGAGALFLGSLLTAAGFHAPRVEAKPTASRFALIGEGLHYVWTNKIVLGAISLDLFAVLLGGATALLPVFARDILHVGPQGFGILRSAPSAGAMLVGFWLATHPVKSGVGMKMFAAVGVFGLATVVFALSRSMALSAVALAFLGAGDMVSVFVRQSLVQIVTPDPMRGRVAAVSTLFIGASNELGEFESGGVASVLGPIGSALFGGVGALVVTGLWAWMFPALRRADRLE
jgi:MFS family permease